MRISLSSFQNVVTVRTDDDAPILDISISGLFRNIKYQVYGVDEI
jgi:hypothetical protein